MKNQGEKVEKYHFLPLLPLIPPSQLTTRLLTYHGFFCLSGGETPPPPPPPPPYTVQSPFTGMVTHMHTVNSFI